MDEAADRRLSTEKIAQRVLVAGIMLALAIAGGAVLFYVADRTPASAPKALAGRIDLSPWDFARSGPISLSGDWSFAPRSFTGIFDSAGRSTARVPGDWRVASGGDGAMSSAYGFGSYGLSIVRSPDQGEMDILMPDEAIAWRLYVDGKLRAANGVPADSADATVVRRESILVGLPDGEASTDLRIEIANYSYDVGGLINPILIGPARSLATRLEALAILNGFFLGGLFVLALYHFILFTARIDDRSSLYFSLFCFLLLLRSFVIAHFPERLLAMRAEQGLSAFDISAKVEYLCFYLGIPAYLGLVLSLFPAESSRRVLRLSVAIGLAFAAAVLVAPARFFMAWTTKPYQAITLAACAYALWVFARAAARRRPGAAYGLAGFTIVMLAAVNDMLHANLVIRTAHLAPLGLMVFMIAQSIIISSRISSTFRRERQLTGELAEEKRLLDRRIAERTAELSASNERLRDMDRAKSRFLATISHELRTPISLIVSPVEQAMRGRYGDSVPAGGELFARLKRNGYRLLNIVEGMFDFARIELGKLSPRMEAVEPVELIAFYAAELESLAQRQEISLAFRDETEGTCSVLLDPRLFEIAFFNIAANALKFTPAGGSMLIEARLEGERLAVSVRDTGVGIEASLLPRIFDKLDWGASEGGRLCDGAGVGLSLSKKIVELHSGEIRVESAAGAGSTFTMFLPAFREASRTSAPMEIGSRGRSILSEAPSGAPAPKPPAAAPAKEDEPSLLLVEDNRELREFMAERLGSSFEVRAAANGSEALASLEADGAPDIVITDVMMPGMDGARLYKEARRLFGEACPPFMLLTARSDPEERREALAEGVVDYLEKPFDLDELELKALSLVSMRAQARDGARRDMKEALSRFLEAEGAGGAGDKRRLGLLDRLTAREAEIVRNAALGLQDKEIAARLGLSARTVSNTLIRIYRKAGVENRLELIRLLSE